MYRYRAMRARPIRGYGVNPFENGQNPSQFLNTEDTELSESKIEEEDIAEEQEEKEEPKAQEAENKMTAVEEEEEGTERNSSWPTGIVSILILIFILFLVFDY